MRFTKDNSLIISHLTDIEGNLRYFKQWFDRSDYLRFNEGCLSFADSKLHCKFIYGGDFCDKGPGDLRIGHALVDFKTKYPHDVSLIAGNREIKCRRFSYELTNNIRQRLLYGAAAYWNPHKPPREYVVQQMQAESRPATSEADIERYVLDKSILTCQTLYLKWMLNETMGCGSQHNKRNTFEYRRMELANIARLPAQNISDDAVTQSFIDSVTASGVVTHYLKQAQLGDIIGETLFIHGAITVENMGFVPGMEASSARITDAKEWIETLNNWYKNQINDWLNDSVEDKLHVPGHKPLDRYVICNPNSIVTSNWYEKGKLLPIPDRVVQFLNAAGIYRVVSGHQPFADFPLLIRSNNLEVIVGDTSYSDSLAIEDNRGEALHNLTIIQLENQSHAFINAIRKNGSFTTVDLPSRQDVSRGEDTIIGHFTPEGQLIRPLSASLLSACQLDGFEVIDNPLKPFQPRNGENNDVP